jgi:hypothetical protein
MSATPQREATIIAADIRNKVVELNRLIGEAMISGIEVRVTQPWLTGSSNSRHVEVGICKVEKL